MTSDSALPIPSATRWWSWPLLVVAFGLCVAMTAVFAVALLTGRLEVGGLESVSGGSTINPLDIALGLTVVLIWAIPGVVVLLRANWHPVGWMLILTGIGFGLTFDIGFQVIWDEMLPLPTAWAAWLVDSWGTWVSFFGIVALLSVFPDGLGAAGSRDRRWRVVRIVAYVALLIVAALQDGVGGFEGNAFDRTYRNPTGLGVIPVGVAGGIVGLLTFILFVGALVSVWRRARRAAETNRSQYTWVLFPFASLVVGILAALALTGTLGEGVWIPVAILYLLIPTAFSISMVRYRWFDIDKLVSRTVTYAVVAAVVIAVYAIPVLVLPGILGLSGDLTVAGATLLAAAVFNPLRRRVQRVVGRRFNRSQYDAESLVSSFAEWMQSAVDLPTVTESLGSAVGTTLHPAWMTVWFSGRSS